jgi:hypothetical protein
MHMCIELLVSISGLYTIASFFRLITNMHSYRYKHVSILLLFIAVCRPVHAAKFTGTNGDGRHEIRIGKDVKFECRVAELGE